jgi:hypothetical protein
MSQELRSAAGSQRFVLPSNLANMVLPALGQGVEERALRWAGKLVRLATTMQQKYQTRINFLFFHHLYII